MVKLLWKDWVFCLVLAFAGLGIFISISRDVASRDVTGYTNLPPGWVVMTDGKQFRVKNFIMFSRILKSATAATNFAWQLYLNDEPGWRELK